MKLVTLMDMHYNMTTEIYQTMLSVSIHTPKLASETRHIHNQYLSCSLMWLQLGGRFVSVN